MGVQRAVLLWRVIVMTQLFFRAFHQSIMSEITRSSSELVLVDWRKVGRLGKQGGTILEADSGCSWYGETDEMSLHMGFTSVRAGIHVPPTLTFTELHPQLADCYESGCCTTSSVRLLGAQRSRVPWLLRLWRASRWRSRVPWLLRLWRVALSAHRLFVVLRGEMQHLTWLWASPNMNIWG